MNNQSIDTKIQHFNMMFVELFKQVLEAVDCSEYFADFDRAFGLILTKKSTRAIVYSLFYEFKPEIREFVKTKDPETLIKHFPRDSHATLRDFSKKLTPSHIEGICRFVEPMMSGSNTKAPSYDRTQSVKDLTIYAQQGANLLSQFTVGEQLNTHIPKALAITQNRFFITMINSLSGDFSDYTNEEITAFFKELMKSPNAEKIFKDTGLNQYFPNLSFPEVCDLGLKVSELVRPTLTSVMTRLINTEAITPQTLQQVISEITQALPVLLPQLTQLIGPVMQNIKVQDVQQGVQDIQQGVEVHYQRIMADTAVNRDSLNAFVQNMNAETLMQAAQSQAQGQPKETRKLKSKTPKKRWE